MFFLIYIRFYICNIRARYLCAYHLSFALGVRITSRINTSMKQVLQPLFVGVVNVRVPNTRT